MKDKRTIYLALGSNQGNRFEQLQAAVNALFETLGDVRKISAVYSSPAMGFEGPEFLNCIVKMESDLSNSKLIKEVLRIEKHLGRIRGESAGYSSRTIDIDVIAIDDAEVDSKSLTVPHPAMQDRLFVLQPMHDLAPDWKHPKLRKTVTELLEACSDESSLAKQSKWLRNPKKNLQLDQFKYLAIEGNIGAGKTSLATLISHDFNAKLVLERFKDNPFLPKFYKDQTRYAFPLEMSFLADRYQQLLDDISQYDLFKEFIVADYDLYKSLIFAKVTLQDEEYALYKKLFHLMYKEIARPDLYIYLYQTTESLLANIKKRGRSYESDIQPEYLEQLNQGYQEYIKSFPEGGVKVIDVSGLDFVANRADYLKVLRAIVS
ncbi:MAG: 2-amino-4-hydroxy-6-hydroxymethyldihydropteridine diphosphokinase [Gilvibacter sp.]|nr:2-amino-4-hydroxy-6-hydroxymethyldihydropteridine diphosphokinase [Gilvibacter sp.]NQX76310.1 2-amino-4-hydroxy-6-hydroxymethyldihydropteridine diphosphokinase [Gilvibacter sp.]